MFVLKGKKLGRERNSSGENRRGNMFFQMWGNWENGKERKLRRRFMRDPLSFCSFQMLGF